MSQPGTEFISTELAEKKQLTEEGYVDGPTVTRRMLVASAADAAVPPSKGAYTVATMELLPAETDVNKPIELGLPRIQKEATEPVQTEKLIMPRPPSQYGKGPKSEEPRDDDSGGIGGFLGEFTQAFADAVRNYGFIIVLTVAATLMLNPKIPTQ